METNLRQFQASDKNRIQSIDVLKGESAVQQFGEKGRNGVMIVTTKKGKGLADARQEATHDDPEAMEMTLMQTDPGKVWMSVETLQGGTAEVIPGFGEGEGINTFRTWVMERIRYPQEAVQQGLQGRVIVQFTVSEQGELGDVTVLESPVESLSQEVIRVLATSPRWTPATTAGKPQAVRMTLPLEFRFSEQHASTIPETATEAHLCQEQIYVDAEQMPTFQGGDLNRFRFWLGSNLHYPTQTVEGLVVAQFIIDTDGRVEEVKILRSPDESLSEEVIRVLEASPVWEPARQEGKPVRFCFTLPIRFAATAN